MHKLDKFRVNGKFHLLMQVEGRVQVLAPLLLPIHWCISHNHALVMMRISFFNPRPLQRAFGPGNPLYADSAFAAAAQKRCVIDVWL
jgi:hypothetical protein